MQNLIDSLPTESLYHIFTYLEWEDKLEARYVCKRWNLLLKEYWIVVGKRNRKPRKPLLPSKRRMFSWLTGWSVVALIITVVLLVMGILCGISSKYRRFLPAECTITDIEITPTPCKGECSDVTWTVAYATDEGHIFQGHVKGIFYNYQLTDDYYDTRINSTSECFYDAGDTDEVVWTLPPYQAFFIVTIALASTAFILWIGVLYGWVYIYPRTYNPSSVFLLSTPNS